MKVLEFLTSNLESLGCVVDGQAVLLPGGEKPVTIDEHKLVLPTNAVLDDNDWGDKYAYFPLCESVTADQSEVFKWLTKMVKANIIEKSILLAEAFFKLRASADKKKSTYAKFLAKFENEVDDKTIKDWTKLTEHADVKDWVRLFVDRNQKIAGEDYLRVLYYTSSWFDVDLDDAFLMGVQMSSKARKRGIVAVMRELLMHEGSDSHMFGSNGDAPNFEALMSFYIKFANQYNKLAAMVQKDIKLPVIELGFAEHMDKVSSYRGRIPPLPGNTGRSTIEKKKEKEDIPFDVDEVREEQLRSRRRDKYVDDREDEDDEPQGLAIFGQRSEHRGGRDDKPRSTGNPLDKRLYTDERRPSRRDDYDDDDYGRGGRRRSRDRRGGYLSFSRDNDDRHGRNERASRWGRR